MLLSSLCSVLFFKAEVNENSPNTLTGMMKSGEQLNGLLNTHDEAFSCRSHTFGKSSDFLPG